MRTAWTRRTVASRTQVVLALPLVVACSSSATHDDATVTSPDGGSSVIADAGVDSDARASKDAASTTPHDAGDGGDAGKPAPAPRWVAAWADAPDSDGATSGANRTYREIVKPTVGSRGKVRLHFSNFFGTAPVTLGTVHIGVQTSGAAVHNDVAVTFGGKSAVTIAAHQFATSDEVTFSFAYGDVLAVTEYVSGSFTTLTHHQQGGGLVTSYATAANAGDKTSDVGGTAFGEHTLQTYLLDRVDVHGDYWGTVATFGSSTTDGVGSGLDAHQTYPEQLAAALHAAGRDDVAIANVGIAGTTVLGAGPTGGINRFGRDVVALPGIVSVIDYLGANDLRASCVKADALIKGKQSLIAQAHAAGIAIYEATTAPSTFCGAQNPSGFGSRFAEGSGEEAQRLLVLDWERHSTKPSGDAGVDAADALIDFDGAIVDPANKSYMLHALDSGDDVHPNAAGYRAMANVIPLSLFASDED